jgi:hypothetical protein
MNGNRRLLFDVNSTSTISDVVAVPEGGCVQINSWNLGPGETAQAFRLLVASGALPSGGDSCTPPQQITPSQILAETPYTPCNVDVEVGQEPNYNVTTIVIQQPGYYRFHITPSALGSAIVEAITLQGEEACRQAASACCCTPEVWWQGVSLSPCLTITPGGSAGHAPIFNIDACCLFQSLTPNPNPVLTDELIFLSGGNCFRATIDEIFSSAIVCDSLTELGVVAPAAGDTIIGVDQALNCKRMDGETFVEFFETPWTGISATPALTIAPGGVNGHGPTFTYDLCADIQAQASCGCEPNPGDQVLIVQAGACVLANWPTVDLCDQAQALAASGNPPNPGDEIIVSTGGNCLRAIWPTVDLCDQIGALPNGALIAGDTVPVREAGGACKQVLATAFGGGGAFDGGPINNPIEGPDGSCAAPTYSFTTDPSSGVFYDPASPVTCDGGPTVVIGWQNCASRLDVGESIRLTAQNGDSFEVGCSATLTTAAGDVTVNSAGEIFLNALSGNVQATAFIDVLLTASNGSAQLISSASIARLRGFLGAHLMAGGTDWLVIQGSGAWLVNGSAGLATQVLTSNGVGASPTWQTPSLSFPVTAPNGSCAAPAYSFTASPDSGMFYTGTAVRIGDDNCTDYIEVGASINIVSSASNVIIDAGGSDILIEGSGTSTDIRIKSGDNLAGRAGRILFELGAGDKSISSNNAEAGFVWPGAPTSNNFGKWGLYSNGTISNGTRLFTMNDVADIEFHGPIGAGGTKHVHQTRDFLIGRDDLPAGATAGFAFLPRVPSVPAVPTNYGGPTGRNPIVVTEIAGTTCLLVYNYSSGAWHSTCFNASGAIASPAFPVSAPDGSCAAPSYSFSSSPDSGMFYDPAGVGSVVIGDDNCTDFIAVGASIRAWAGSNGGVDVNVTAGGSPVSLIGAAEDVRIYGATSSGGAPGDILVQAGRATGAFNNGATVEIFGGRADGADRLGGNVFVRGGMATGVAFGSQGGDLTLTGGSHAATQGGRVIIQAGAVVGTPGTNPSVEMGQNGSHSAGAQLSLPARPSSSIDFSGRGGIAGTTPDGQSISMSGGDAAAGSGANGGFLRFAPGRADGAGQRGQARWEYFNGGTNVTIGGWSSWGDVVAGGYGDGTVGGAGVALPVGNTTGFFWGPRIAGAPTGVPSGLDFSGPPSNYANPIAFEQNGGNIVLWVYSFAAAAWRSVTLV